MLTLASPRSLALATIVLFASNCVIVRSSPSPAPQSQRGKPKPKKKAVKIIGTFGMPDETFGYAVRKEDADLLKKLNEGLKRLKKSPYWKELVSAYIEKKK